MVLERTSHPKINHLPERPASRPVVPWALENACLS